MKKILLVFGTKPEAIKMALLVKALENEVSKEKGIPTAVQYPIPFHLEECFVYLGYKKESFAFRVESSLY